MFKVAQPENQFSRSAARGVQGHLNFEHIKAQWSSSVTKKGSYSPNSSALGWPGEGTWWSPLGRSTHTVLDAKRWCEITSASGCLSLAWFQGSENWECSSGWDQLSLRGFLVCNLVGSGASRQQISGTCAVVFKCVLGPRASSTVQEAPGDFPPLTVNLLTQEVMRSEGKRTTAYQTLCRH